MIKIIIFVNEIDIVKLNCGDIISLSGIFYIVRDVVYKRLIDCINKGEELLFDVYG